MRINNPILGPLIKEGDDKVFIVSDLHINHNKEFLWKNRADLIKNFHIKNVDDYSNYIMNELSTLGYSHNGDAYLISLGDNFFNDKEGIWLDRFSKLPFKKIYTLGGNHTSGFNTLLTGNTFEYNNIQLLASNIPFRITKTKFIILSHFPVLDIPHGFFGTLCGHCHGANINLNKDSSEYGRIFDCGVENALKLKQRIYFTLDEVINILEHKVPKDHSKLFEDET